MCSSILYKRPSRLKKMLAYVFLYHKQMIWVILKNSIIPLLILRYDNDVGNFNVVGAPNK